MRHDDQNFSRTRERGATLRGVLAAFTMSIATASAHAVVVLDETFLGTADDGNAFILAEPRLHGSFGNAPDGNLALFDFNLSRLANNNNLVRNRARLYAGTVATGVEMANVKPTDDEASFDPVLMSIDSAVMTFHFSSGDPTVERIRVRINIPNAPNEIVFDQGLDLNGSGFVLDLDFAALGLLDQLADGRVTSVALAPGALAADDPLAPPRNIANDYQIDRVRLFATASVPVPEPSTLALVGVGLVATGVLRRRKRVT